MLSASSRSQPIANTSQTDAVLFWFITTLVCPKMVPRTSFWYSDSSWLVLLLFSSSWSLPHAAILPWATQELCSQFFKNLADDPIMPLKSNELFSLPKAHVLFKPYLSQAEWSTSPLFFHCLLIILQSFSSHPPFPPSPLKSFSGFSLPITFPWTTEQGRSFLFVETTE